MAGLEDFVTIREAIWCGARSLSEIIAGETGLMGSLMAAFDESGKLADSLCVTFGGYMAEFSSAQAMSIKWNKLIQAHGLEYIRMTDALRFQGQFDGWKKERRKERDELLRELATMAHPHTALLIATPMSCEEFKNLPSDDRQRLKNPQYCGFEGCVKVLTQEAIRLGDSLQLYCDSSEEFSATCLGLYHKLRMTSQDFRERCTSLTFAEDRQFPPLQLADVFASCVRQNALRKTLRPDPVVDDLLEIFGKSGKIGGFVHYRPGEGLGDAIVE
jgi:hypothetical protein